jgi:hypothetical protein
MANLGLQQGATGKQFGAVAAGSAGEYGEVLVSHLQPNYYEWNSRGNVFYLNASGVTPTAFTGGAAGTPLIGVMNPTGSGKNLVFLGAMIGSRAAASAAGTVTFNIWGGPSAAPTGTVTNPTNLLSLTSTGSVAKGFVNVAMTGSTAISQIMPLETYYWATAAAAFLTPSIFDLQGMVTAIPGNLIALGATAALASATWDASLVWLEVA